MPFSDPIVSGTRLVRTAIQSDGFVPGVSGWQITRAGAAQFADVDIVVTGADSGLTIVRSSDGTVMGSIDENGVGSFQDLTVVNDITLAGSSLNARLASGPQGLVAYGSWPQKESFEFADFGWIVAGGTIAQDQTRAYTGAFSGLLTVSGSPVQAYTRCPLVACVAGTQYTANGKFYSVAGYASHQISIDWFNSSQVYLSTSVSAVAALPAATWAEVQVIGTAPAGAAYMQYGPTLTGSPPNGTQIWLDDVFCLPTTTTTSEIGLFEVAFTADPTRLYKLDLFGINNSTVATDQVYILLRDGGSSAPTISSQRIGGNGGAILTRIRDLRVMQFPAGLRRLLVTVLRASGTGSASVFLDQLNPCTLLVEDIGSTNQRNTAVTNTGGGTPPPAVATYTKTYACTWSGSYNGSGNKSTFGGSNLAYQGDIGDGQGNRKSLLGFPYATIAADLAGATINSCTLTLYFQHWWNNAAISTAVIGTHNQAVGSAPTTFGSNSTNRVQSGNWPNPGKRTVDLGVTIGQNFRDGTAKGICLGPGPSSALAYYGYASGFGASNPPVLTITYTK